MKNKIIYLEMDNQHKKKNSFFYINVIMVLLLLSSCKATKDSTESRKENSSFEIIKPSATLKSKILLIDISLIERNLLEKKMILNLTIKNISDEMISLNGCFSIGSEKINNNMNFVVNEIKDYNKKDSIVLLRNNIVLSDKKFGEKCLIKLAPTKGQSFQVNLYNLYNNVDYSLSHKNIEIYVKALLLININNHGIIEPIESNSIFLDKMGNVR